MLDRRSFLAATSAAGLAAPAVRRPRDAATPKHHRGDGQADRRHRRRFDPAESYEFSNNEVYGNCYRRLVTPDPNDATKIDRRPGGEVGVSKDGLTFTFQLRRGVMFDSGKPLTAEDVAFSLQRVVKLNKTPGFILTQFGFTADNVEKLIRATGDHTLVMELPEVQATSFVLYCLSATCRQRGREGGGAGATSQRRPWQRLAAPARAGAGPTSWSTGRRATTSSWTPTRMRPVKPRLPRVVHPPCRGSVGAVPAGAEGRRRHRARPGADQLKPIGQQPGPRVSCSPQLTSMYIGMNMANPTSRRCRTRQALKWAIDYDAIAKNITPNPGRSGRPSCRSGLPGAISDNRSRRTSPRPRRCWPRPGYPDGFAVTLDHISPSRRTRTSRRRSRPTWPRSASRCSLLPGEQKQVITKMRARQHQIAMMTWFPDYLDPNSNAQAFCANPDDSDNEQAEDPGLALPLLRQGADRRGRWRRRRSWTRRSAWRCTPRCSAFHGARAVRHAAAAGRRGRRAAQGRHRPA